VPDSYPQSDTWIAESRRLEGLIPSIELSLPSKACVADLTNSFELPNCCINIFSVIFPNKDTK